MPLPAPDAPFQLVLVRHGETAWSLTGQHTGRTDLPLTETGERAAAALSRRLDAFRFAKVFVSPLVRATKTAALAGFSGRMVVRSELAEWDYGAYEGLTTAEIRARAPGWTLWQSGVPGGETLAQVVERVERFLNDVRTLSGPVAVFAHGHLLRVLTARWLGLAPEFGASLSLGTAAVSVLGRDGTLPLLQLWNDQSHLTLPE